MNNKKREDKGQKASLIGLITNLLLAVLKIILGIVFKTIAVLADGINNISDSLSSIIAFIGFKLSKKPSDKKHPFGHARSEYIATFIISFTIFTAGIHLIIASIKKIMQKEIFNYDIILVILLSLSVLVKITLGIYYFKVSKKIDSDILIANAKDSFLDALSTTLILISILVLYYFKISIDGYIGIIIGLLILKLSFQVLFKAINKLLGTKVSEDVENKLKDIIFSRKEVLGMHDLIVHDYGPNNLLASAHIEIDSNTKLIKAHKIIDSIEREVFEKQKIQIVLHIDPIEKENIKLKTIKEIVLEELYKINKDMSAHDFRLEKQNGQETLFFDIGLYEDIDFNENNIKEILENKLLDFNIKLNLTIDRNYTYKNI